MEQDDPLGREGAAEPQAANHDAQAVNREADAQAASQSVAEPKAARRGGVDWEAIRDEYIYGDKSLDRIAAVHGSTRGGIRYRAKRDGWVRLAGTKWLQPGPAARLPEAPRPTADQLRRRRLAKRLFKVIEAKLREIEMRMNQADPNAVPPSAADTERDVRSINSLMGLYAKVVELDEAARASATGKEEEEAESKDAEQLCRDLARRLEGLNREGNA